MTNKEKYRQLCQVESSIPLFLKDWWLDATSLEGNWDVAIYEENGNIVAAWPYYYKSKWGIKVITTAYLTKYQGIWTKTPSHDLLVNKLLVRNLINQLPKFSSYAQMFHPTFTNWTALHWEGFKQTTKYTFVIDDISDMTKVVAGFAPSRRRDINKGQKSFHLEIGYDTKAFYQLRKKNLADLGQKIGYCEKEFVSLVEACKKHDACEFLMCKDEQGRVVCYSFIVWDANTSYYLITGFEPELCKNGASDYLTLETLKYASTKTKSFDFEGSMSKGVAHNLHSFAEKQIPYFFIYKDNFLFRMLRALKNER